MICHPLFIHCSYQWLIPPTGRTVEGHSGEVFTNYSSKSSLSQALVPPSSIQSCPTAADTSVAAGMKVKGLPGLACTPSISFLSGGEMLWAFHLCKRSYMTMSFHQIWFQKSNNDGSSYYSIIISTKLYVALLRPPRRETTHACAFLAAGPLPAWIRHTAYSWWYFKDSATKGACF